MVAVRKDHEAPEPAFLFAPTMRFGLPNRPAMDEPENAKPIFVERPNDGFQIVGPSGTDCLHNHNIRRITIYKKRLPFG